VEEISEEAYTHLVPPSITIQDPEHQNQSSPDSPKSVGAPSQILQINEINSFQ